MSYILDALRRADAEREREKGAVPGLHARPLGVPAAEPLPAPARPQGLWLALGVSVGLLAALGWWSFGRSVPVPVTVVAAAPEAAPVSVPTTAPPPSPSPIVQVVPVPVPIPPRPPPPPPPTVQPAPAPAPAPAPGAAPSAATWPVPAQARVPLAAPAPAPAAAVQRAIPLAQLSPDLRREMPPMTVGGSVYSPDPPSRFVIINGQVVREGEGAATGITVERIGPKSAVLRWREMRIEVPL